MYRLAVLSDVHADLHALEDALAQIDRLGCDGIVCAGDLVGYGAEPEATLALLRARAIPCVRGNHDRWALQRGQGAWSDEAWAFLSALPPSWNGSLEGVRVAVCHGAPGNDMQPVYPGVAGERDLARWLEQAGAQVLLVGHTHLPFRLAVPIGRMVANPGRLLRDPVEKVYRPLLIGGDDPALTPDPPEGTFGVLELPARTFTVYLAKDGAVVPALGT